MTSLLESGIRAAVASAFKGQLLTGTLRRETSTGLDAYGDETGVTVVTYTFDGIRDSFSAFYAAQAGIPLTDVKILIIAGSLAVDPLEDDKIQIGGEWFQVRKILAKDPANASITLQAYRIGNPDG